VVQRHEGVVENIIGDVAALRNGRGFVEGKVGTEIDAALAVLFLGLRKSVTDDRDRKKHDHTSQ
jgi:hypothetical protein